MSTYRQIFKSTSILGSSQALGTLIAMGSVKINAFYLGPSGTGLIGNYQNILGLVCGVATLGVGTAAVREMSLALGEGNEVSFVKNLQVMQTLLFILGLIGWAILAISCVLFSNWTFGNSEHAVGLAILGVNILLTNLTVGWNARFQAKRQIGRLAMNGLISSFFGVFLAWGFYASLGKDGIIPVLILSSILTCLIASWFGRKEKVKRITFLPKEWRDIAQKQIKLGFFLALAGIVASLTTWGIGAYVTTSADSWLNGIYRTAYNLSVFFVTFILGAMAGDYYPRLTMVIKNKIQACQVVREQLEVGMLLAIPCIFWGIVLCPFLIQIFYSNEYFAAIEPMRWFMLGCLMRVVTWPFGFVILALGKGLIYTIVEIVFSLLNFVFAYFLFTWNSVAGLGQAMVVLYIIYFIVVFCICRKFIQFKFGRAGYFIFAGIACVFLNVYLLKDKHDLDSYFYFSIIFLIFVSIFCLRLLMKRLNLSVKSILKLK